MESQLQIFKINGPGFWVTVSWPFRQFSIPLHPCIPLSRNNILFTPRCVQHVSLDNWKNISLSQTYSFLAFRKSLILFKLDIKTTSRDSFIIDKSWKREKEVGCRTRHRYLEIYSNLIKHRTHKLESA